MSELAKTEEKKPVSLFNFTSFESAYAAAEKISKSELVPKNYKGKPDDIVIAWQYGYELGLQPLQALQNIASVNGMPTVWGGAVLGIVKTKPDYEYIVETYDEATKTAICKVKRKGEPEAIGKFSEEDAKIAGLKGQNVHAKYPKRMLQMRARYIIKDVFAHHFKGILLAEDYVGDKYDEDGNSINGGEITPEPVKAQMLPIGEDPDETPETTVPEPEEPKEPETPAEPMPTEKDKEAFKVAVKAAGVICKNREELTSAAKTALGYPEGADFTLDTMTQEQCHEATNFYIDQAG